MKDYEPTLKLALKRLSLKGYRYLDGSWWRLRDSAWRRQSPEHVRNKLRQYLAKEAKGGVVDGSYISRALKAAEAAVVLGGPDLSQFVFENTGKNILWKIDDRLEDAWEHRREWELPAVVPGACWKDGVVRITKDSDGRYHSQLVPNASGAVWSPKGSVPFKYGVFGRTPMFDRLMADWGLSEIQDFVLAMIGRTLTEYTDVDGMVFLYGQGGSGKSTLAKLVSRLAGTHSTATLESTVALSGRFQAAALEQSRLTIIDENPPFKQSPVLQEAVNALKAICANAGVNIERKGADPYYGELNTTVWACGNNPPAWAKDEADIAAWERRLFVIPMNMDRVQGKAKLKRNQHLDELIASEGQKLANNAVRAFVRWLQGGEQVPAMVQRATSAAVRSSLDGIALWIQESVVRDPEAKTGRDFVLANWKQSDYYDDAYSDKAVLARLSKMGAVVTRRMRDGVRTSYLNGIRLADADWEPDTAAAKPAEGTNKAWALLQEAMKI